jgi:hypothetical protein
MALPSMPLSVCLKYSTPKCYLLHHLTTITLNNLSCQQCTVTWDWHKTYFLSHCKTGVSLTLTALLVSGYINNHNAHFYLYLQQKSETEENKTEFTAERVSWGCRLMAPILQDRLFKKNYVSIYH